MNSKIKSIKLKYIISSLLICIISLIIVSIMSYLLSYNITAEQSNMRIQQTSLLKATELDSWFKQYGSIIQNMTEDIEISQSFDEKLLFPKLKGKFDLYKSSVLDFYIGLESSNRLISGSEWVPDAGYNYKTRNWYTESLKSNNVIYTEPYVDAMTGTMVVTIAKSIKDKSDGKIIGVIAADIVIDNIIKVVRDFNISENSYTFLLNKNGDILTHKKVDFLPTSDGLKNINTVKVADYSKIMDSINSDTMNTIEIKDYDGYNKYFVLSKMKSTGWIFGIAVDQIEYRRPLDKLLFGFVIAFLISIIIGILIIFKFINNMVAPIKSLNNTVKSFSAQNMDIRSSLNLYDEIGELSSSFNLMADTIQEYSNNLEGKVNQRTKELSEKNQKIMESIDYAERLQRSILPLVNERLGITEDKYFIIWKPRDIVGGDMYWCKRIDNYVLVGVADCTGHGVPGALMTMTLGAILDSFTGSFDGVRPSQMLYEINLRLKQILGQNNNDSIADDGADMALCIIDTSTKKLSFSGAKLSIFVSLNGEITEYKGSRNSVGYSKNINVNFTDIEIDIDKDMTFYITTDGFLDQNSELGKGGMARSGLIRLIKVLEGKSMPKQKQLIEDDISQKLASVEQRDDITLIGFRF